eukprot:gene10997-12826_t
MTDTETSTSSKRKASAAFVPDSIASYLMGALRDNFDHLKSHIQQDCDFFVSTNSYAGAQTKLLLEEMCRYLYLLAESSFHGMVWSTPSYHVHQALQCLMLDPVLYWKMCNVLLILQGKDAEEIEMRALPHDALDGRGEGKGPSKARYQMTLDRYKEVFGADPPEAIWGEYKVLLLAKDRIAAAAKPSVTTASIAPPEREKGLRDSVELRIIGSNGRSIYVVVALGDKISSIIDRFAQQQTFNPKLLELTYRHMILRSYMMPYSFNMKDGDIIHCNIPVDTANDSAEGVTAVPATTSVSKDDIAAAITAHFANREPDPAYAANLRPVVTKGNASKTASSTQGPSTEETVTVGVVDDTGDVVYYRLRRTSLMGQIIRNFAERLKVAAATLRFVYRGKTVSSLDTPQKLSMKTGDEMRVYRE